MMHDVLAPALVARCPQTKPLQRSNGLLPFPSKGETRVRVGNHCAGQLSSLRAGCSLLNAVYVFVGRVSAPRESEPRAEQHAATHAQ